MSEIDPVEFGKFQAQVELLAEKVDSLDTTVKQLTATISELRGGRKLLVTIAAFIAALSGGLTWIASHIKYTP